MKEKSRLPCWKKWLLVLLCIVLAGLLGPLTVNLYMVLKTQDEILPAEGAGEYRADCILVLGAQVYAEQPSPMLEDRLLVGIELYEAGAAPRLILSGDGGREGYDEVRIMKQYCLDAGVPEEDILEDKEGFSTYESLFRAKAVYQAASLIVVTQQYHLYRSLYIAQDMGIEAIGAPSDLRSYYGIHYCEARELLARCKDFLLCLVNYAPAMPAESDFPAAA
jgi:vancomycin permeability regulator SanA